MILQLALYGPTTNNDWGDGYEADVGEESGFWLRHALLCGNCGRYSFKEAEYYCDISLVDMSFPDNSRFVVNYDNEFQQDDEWFFYIPFTPIKPGIGKINMPYYAYFNIQGGTYSLYCGYCGYRGSYKIQNAWYRVNNYMTLSTYAYYSLNYNANGDSVTGMPEATTSRVANTTANLTTTIAEPKRDGYTFLGWADSPEAKEAQYPKGTSITLNWEDGLGSSSQPVSKELYAVWKPNATYVEDKDLTIRKEFVGIENYDAIPKEFCLEYEVTNSLSDYTNNGKLFLESENLQVIESGENPILEWTVPVPNYVVESSVTEKTKLKINEINSEIDGYKTIISSNDEATIENNSITFEIESTFTEGSRTIINTYEKRNDLEYTINYIEKETGNILETVKVPGQVFGNTIISSEVVEIKEIEGYIFDSIEPESIIISTDNQQNVINVYYNKNTKNITVVEIWNGGTEETSNVYLKQISSDSQIVQIDEKTLTADSGWTYTWNNLKRLDESGNEIKYTVDGEPKEGYYCEKIEDFENNIITLIYNKYGTINITKVDNRNSNMLLPDAKFKLEKVVKDEATGKWITIENNEEFIVLEGITNEDGILTFDDLKYGFYKLTETKAPKNYIIGNSSIDIIEVNGEKENLLNVQITVSNIRQYELPLTGGVGELKGRGDLLIGSIFVIIFLTKKAVVPIRRKKSRF